VELDEALRALRGDPLTGLPAVGARSVPARSVLRALEGARGDEATRLAAVAQRLGLSADEVLAVRTTAELRPAALEVRPSAVAVLTLALPLGLGGWLAGAPVAMLAVALSAPTGRAALDPEALRGLAVLAITGLSGIGLLLLRPAARGAVATLALAGVVLAAAEPHGEPLGNGLLLAASLTTYVPVVGRWFGSAGWTSASGLALRPAITGAVAAAVVGAVALVCVRVFRGVFTSMGVELPWVTQWLLDLGALLSELPVLGVAASAVVAALLLTLPRRREGLGFGLALGGGSLVAFLAVRALFLPIEALQRALAR